MRTTMRMRLAGAVVLAGLLTGGVAACSAGDWDDDVDFDGPSAQDVDEESAEVADEDAAPEPTSGVAGADDEVRVRQGTVTHLEDGVQVGVYSLLGEVAAQLSVVTSDESRDVELEVGEAAEVGGHTIELRSISGGGVRVAVTDPDGLPLGLG